MDCRLVAFSNYYCSTAHPIKVPFFLSGRMDGISFVECGTCAFDAIVVYEDIFCIDNGNVR